MSADISKPITIPEKKKAEFQALTQVSGHAWPTIILTFVVSILSVTLIVLGFLDIVALPVAGGLIGLVLYFIFSVVHDAIHRAISSNAKVNDWLGEMAVFIAAPYGNLALFRWAHMEHHRFTNDNNKDPDRWSHEGPGFLLPLRWAFVDVWYVKNLLSSSNPAAKNAVKKVLPRVACYLAVVVGLIVMGFGAEYFWLALVPGRILWLGVGFSFMWLPHNHWHGRSEFSQSNNYTAATVIRTGKEWILNPVLQYQNYHMIHHMWPTTPFYNNQRVWDLLKDDFSERDIALAHDFEMYPKIVQGSERMQAGGV